MSAYNCVYLRSTCSIMLTLILSISSAKSQDLNEPIRTGSGSIFGGPIVNYSTILYHKEALQLDSVEKKTIKGLERYIGGRKKERLRNSDRILKLKFHNYTSMRSQEFRDNVEIQVEALQRDFTVDDRLYYNLTGEEEPQPNDLKIFRFITVGNNYNSNEQPWEGWDTFSEPNGPMDHISVFVVENLPSRLGHGYAQYSWINRPDAADIIVASTSFGRGYGDFTEGKVLTHLLANYLGLLPLTGASDCGDDGVLDTPIHNCPINFCDTPNPISTCDNQYFLPDNFMSHSPDACKSNFTVGQWKRMMHTLNFIIQNEGQ